MVSGSYSLYAGGILLKAAGSALTALASAMCLPADSERIVSNPEAVHVIV